jgi:hypothetical protein
MTPCVVSPPRNHADPAGLVEHVRQTPILASRLIAQYTSCQLRSNILFACQSPRLSVIERLSFSVTKPPPAPCLPAPQVVSRFRATTPFRRRNSVVHGQIPTRVCVWCLWIDPHGGSRSNNSARHGRWASMLTIGDQSVPFPAIPRQWIATREEPPSPPTLSRPSGDPLDPFVQPS